MTGQTAKTAGSALYAGVSEMSSRLRSFDWRSSPLGPPDAWPQALQVLASLILNSKQPIFLTWGPERILIYNDAYSPLCGARHPDAFARPFAEVWYDIIDDVGPILERAYAGQPTMMDEIAFVMHRNGYPEEAHFAFSYTPIHGGDGEVLGMFCACNETTARVITERRMTAVLESVTDGFYAIDDDWKITVVSSAAARHCRRDRADILNRQFGEVFPDCGGSEIERGLQQVFSTGAPLTFEVRSPARPERTIEVRAAPMAGGGIAVSFSDVTQRRRTADAVHESEMRFRTAADSSPALMWMTDSDGQITFANRRYKEFFGVETEAMLGDGWRRIVHPGDVDAFHQAFLAQFQARLPFHRTVRVTHPKLGIRWLSCDGSARFGPDGEFFGYTGVNIDVTDAVATTLELRESEGRLRAAVLASPFPTMLHAEDGEVIELSRKWMQITGYAREDISTHFDWARLAYPDGSDRFESLIKQEFHSEEEVEAGEVEIRTKDGTTRTWDFYTVGLGRLSDGRHLRISAAVDVTARKAAERRQVLLAREVDHRAKNVLTVMLALVKLTRAETHADLIRAVEGRVAALARAHILLAEGRWSGAELRALAVDELTPFAGQRYSLDGPAVMLKPDDVQPVGMILYELATNAAKHGALSQGEGRIEIAWTWRPDGGLDFRWCEIGGPRLAGAPACLGFGSQMIAAAAAQLGGTATFDWRRDGLCVTLQVAGDDVTRGVIPPA